MMEADIVICGGSLAGSATALRLKQLGFTPLVIEKKRFPRPKLCGEFLGPDSFPVLKTLGLWERVRQAAYGPIEHVLFNPMRGPSLTIKMAWLSKQTPYGLGIPRHILDTLLLEAVQSMGIPVLEAHKVSPGIQRQGNRFILELVSTAPELTLTQALQTPILVDATGRQGGLQLAGQPVAVKRTAPHVGVKVNIRLAQPMARPALQMYFFPDAYGGIQPLSPVLYNLCFLAHPRYAPLIHGAFDDFLSQSIGQNPKAMALLQGSQPVETFQTTSNLDYRFHPPTQTGLLQVGDALGTVDPFTGSGMALALQTGVLAAETIAAGCHAGQDYPTLCAEVTRRYHQFLAPRLRLLRPFRPYLFSSTLQSLTFPLLPPLLPALTRIFR